MKAVRIHEYGGPDRLIYEEVPTPVAGPGQVLVRLEAASVNPVDAAVRENRFPTPKDPPKIIGADGAGVVAAVGEGVTAVKPGDEVFFSGLGVGSEGTYAEYVVVREAQAVAKPASLSFAEAAALGLAFSTAYYALVRRGKLEAGETVLVQGAAGGVGSASVQLAKALGAHVIATVSNETKAAFVRRLGADQTVNYRTQDVAEEVRRLTDGRGADLVHELVASANLPIDVAAAAKFGRVVCTGKGPGETGTVPIDPALAKDVSVLFMSTSNATVTGVAEILRGVADLAAAGKVHAVIGATWKLSEARAAHEALAGDHLGKIVLVPGRDPLSQ